MRLLLDTHVLLWWLAGEGPLSPRQAQALERAGAAGERVGLAAISLWEIAKLVERGRVELRGAADVFFEEVDRHPAIGLLALSPRIALESTRLGPRVPSDPADQLIVATARVHGLALVTADRRIRESGAVAVV